MKKVKTIFRKDPSDLGRVIDEVNEGMGWVFDGEGCALRKMDGTCCLVRDGKLYKRFTLRKGKDSPIGYEPVDYDKETGKGFGWVPVDFSNKSNKYHKEAWKSREINIKDGTYELVGPKIQGNPEGFREHVLISHESTGHCEGFPLEFEKMRAWLILNDVEGVVFHHQDGRMGKIRKSDFGIKR